MTVITPILRKYQYP